MHENIGAMLKQIITFADLLGLWFMWCICFIYAVIFDH